MRWLVRVASSSSAGPGCGDRWRPRLGRRGERLQPRWRGQEAAAGRAAVRGGGVAAGGCSWRGCGGRQ